MLAEQLLHEILSKGIHITKRDLFYTDVKLFRQQNDSDTILDDVACMVGCTRKYDIDSMDACVVCGDMRMYIVCCAAAKLDNGTARST